MEKIGLVETIEALRTELRQAVVQSAGEAIQFPVGPVQLEFHVGVTKTGEGKAGIRAWVIELGGGGSLANESIQKVTITLEPPVNRDGERVLVTRGSDEKP